MYIYLWYNINFYLTIISCVCYNINNCVDIFVDVLIQSQIRCVLEPNKQRKYFT